MRHHDKLEQYIKKEVDSIPYDDDTDEMWEAFQSANAEELNPSNSSKYFLPILVALFLISAIGIFFIKNNNASAISNQTSETTSNSTISNTQKTETTTRLDEQNIDLSNEEKENSSKSILQQEDDKKLNLQNDANNISNNTISKSNSTQFISKNTNSNTRNSTASSLPSFGEFSRNNESIVLKESTTFNQNNTSTSLEQNFENKSKSMTTEGKETFPKRESITLLNPLLSTFNGLQLLEIEDNRLTEIKRCEIRRLQSTYFRAGFSTSNNQILRSAFEYGRVRKTCGTRGWKYGIGLGLDDGYSLSQDSLVFLNGVVIQEIQKDKDLDYLIQSFVSGEYFFTKNNWTIGLGGKVNFALLNRFRTFDETRYVQPIQGGLATAGSEGIIFNHWDGINRFGLDGFLNLSYRVNNLEFGLSASKRFNKVIKKDRAQREKNNLPVQFGAHISRYF